jgi:hypothetical protein
MDQNENTFAQLTDFLTGRVLNEIVDEHKGKKRVGCFTCLNQMLCMRL